MINIVAIDGQGNREEIDDLYWFEENHVHDFNGDGYYSQYKFEIFIDGKLAYPKEMKNNKRGTSVILDHEGLDRLNQWTK